MTAQHIPYPVHITHCIRWHLNPANLTGRPPTADPQWALAQLKREVKRGVISKVEALEIKTGQMRLI